MTLIKGTSTGVHESTKKEYEEKKLKREREQIHGVFSTDKQPTPEQIEKKRLREEKEAKLATIKYEKSHRGGFQKTKKGKAMVGRK